MIKRLTPGVLCLAAILSAQTSLDGTWEGAISIQNIELSMIVTFVTEGKTLNASIDIPQQGATGLELVNVSFSDPKVHFELDSELGLAVFDGEHADGEITGDFTQGAAKGSFVLKPESQEILPYTEQEVQVYVNEDVTLAGTLTIPKGVRPFPAAILITGSGHQNRDEDIYGFKIFAQIADHLTRNGVVVLRCDDRGVGESTGDGGWEFNTSQDYAQDVLAQVEYLKTISMASFGEMPMVDISRIGLIGHSEGGIIASMVDAQFPDIEFTILMAGTALPGDEIMVAQMKAILEAEGLSETEMAIQLELQQRMFQYVRSGDSKLEKKLRSDIRKEIIKQIKQLPKEDREIYGNIKKYADQRVESQMEVINSKWYQHFLNHDPRENLGKMDSRVLAFFGEYDTQVPAEMNTHSLDSLYTEVGKENYQIKTCCKANHLFQPAITGSPSEYPQLPKEFTPCFLPAITNWVHREPIEEECDHHDEPTTPVPGCPPAGCGGCPNAGKHGK